MMVVGEHRYEGCSGRTMDADCKKSGDQESDSSDSDIC